jgi:hypothetical protein
MCLPPLNADFFTQLQRITVDRHQETIQGVIRDVVSQGVIRDVVSLYGPHFSLTLEQYFTQLEAMLETAKSAKGLPKEFKPASLTAMRTRLLDALSAILEESADVAKQRSAAREYRCAYHDALVDVLDPQDTVISFNYDCVIDHALRERGGGKWSARIGYTFPNASR